MAAERRTYLGFDFGLARIGVAVGENQPAAAFALTTLQSLRGQPDWAAIGGLIDTWRPAALVVGVPVHMDGAGQPVTRAARRFCHQLRGRFGLSVHEAEERLTSRRAREVLKIQRRAGKRRKNAGRDEDKIAASLILGDWLEQHAPL